MAGDPAPIEGGRADDAVVAAGTGDDGGAGKRMTPLPEAEVKWVLSRKSLYLSSTSKKLVSPESAAMFNEARDSFVEYQEWMCNEFNTNNGVVKVDDEFLAERAETKRLMEELATMFDNSVDFTGWAFSDCPSDFFKDEDDSDEEDDKDEPESN